MTLQLKPTLVGPVTYAIAIKNGFAVDVFIDSALIEASFASGSRCIHDFSVVGEGIEPSRVEVQSLA